MNRRYLDLEEVRLPPSSGDAEKGLLPQYRLLGTLHNPKGNNENIRVSLQKQKYRNQYSFKQYG